MSDFLVGESLDELSAGSSESGDPSLEGELANWGMDIPPVLASGDEEVALEIPNIIDADDDDFSFLDTLGSDKNLENKIEESDLQAKSESLQEILEDTEVDIGLNKEDENEILSRDEAIEEAIVESSEVGVSKSSILDHLGKDFFSEDNLTGEHSIDELVSDTELDSTSEFKPDLQELSSALKGDEAAPLDGSAEEDLLPDESDLEYPDLSSLSVSSEPDEEVLLPDNDDLAYPGEEIESSISAEEIIEPTSKLIPADELADDIDPVVSGEETDPAFNITQEMKNDLASEIEEGDEVDPDDFWATDDFPKIKKTLDKPITEVQASKQIKEDFFKDIDEEDNFKIIPSKRFSSITLDEVAPPQPKQEKRASFDEKTEAEIVEKVKEALTPALEKIVKDLFSEKIEQIAWEVIPDLAENIIKHEVEEIAKQVYLSKESSNK